MRSSILQKWQTVRGARGGKREFLGEGGDFRLVGRNPGGSPPPNRLERAIRMMTPIGRRVVDRRVINALFLCADSLWPHRKRTVHARRKPRANRSMMHLERARGPPVRAEGHGSEASPQAFREAHGAVRPGFPGKYYAATAVAACLCAATTDSRGAVCRCGHQAPHRYRRFRSCCGGPSPDGTAATYMYGSGCRS